MGFFSWETSDTKESIANVFQKIRTVKTVYLIQPEGRPPIREDGYKGYGEFGGVDAYAWLARMNNPQEYPGSPDKQGCTQQERHAGIIIEEGYLDRGVNVKYHLKFSHDPSAVYENLEPARICKYQGFFYKKNKERDPGMER